MLIVIEQEMQFLSILVGWTYFLPASFGALFYLYCRYAIADQAFAAKDLLHFIPFVLCCLLNLDILLQPTEVKLEFLLVNAPQTLGFQLGHTILFLQAFIYIGLSAWFIWRSQRQANDNLAGFNPAVFDWLWKITLLNTVIWTFKAIASFVPQLIILSRFADGLILVFICIIALAQWRNPKLFLIEQFSADLYKTDLAFEQNSEQAKTNNSEERNSSSGVLDSDTRQQLLNSIIQQLVDNKLYLDSRLTLAGLAQSTGVSSHHLSEVLNQEAGKNFYQFINQYRIDYICEQFAQDSSQKILDLAMTAGFSSKSTFNAVFKQIKHMTPSQYRAQLEKTLS